MQSITGRTGRMVLHWSHIKHGRSMQKYRMDWLMEIPAYRQLIKGDGFRVEFGEFWDWKIILACEKAR